MDISNLTSQITALRAETQERSISPERVGSLLQQLANLIKSAAESAATQNDIYEITDNALSNIRASVAATANGLSITLTYSELDGEEFPQTVTLPLASSEAAGVLSAADYAALRSLINGGTGSGGGSGMTDTERAILNGLAAHFVRLGNEGDVWRSSQSAEEEAKKLIYCGNPDIWFIYYYVQGSKYGLIEQHVCDDTCIQILHWDSAVSQRTITFTDTDRTAISSVGAWTAVKTLTATEANQLQYAATATGATLTAGESSQKTKFKIWLTLRNINGQMDAEYDADIPLASSSTMGVMSAADKVKLDGIPDAAKLAALFGRDNFGIHNLGNVGNASAPGETAAAALSIVSDTSIKWVIYTFSTYVSVIHQTHNDTTTVQDMYFGGNRHSRRTITFTDNTRSAIASVGSWTSVGTDIGVNRNTTSATIKMVHPLMENTAGLLTLTIGQANDNYAGLMSRDNLRTLNYLSQREEEITDAIQEMSQQITNLTDAVQSLQSQINNLGNIYVKQKKLWVTATPAIINIPVSQSNSSGGTITSRVEQTINLAAYDEDENPVDVMDCNITWRFENQGDSIFFVEYEGMKRYVTFYADEDDYWAGNTDSKLILTLTNQDNQVSGEVEVILRRTSN